MALIIVIVMKLKNQFLTFVAVGGGVCACLSPALTIQLLF